MVLRHFLVVTEPSRQPVYTGLLSAELSSLPLLHYLYNTKNRLPKSAKQMHFIKLRTAGINAMARRGSKSFRYLCSTKLL